MATPKCPSCNDTRFELTEIPIEKASFKTFGVICSHCGAVVGVQEFYNSGDLLMKLAAALNVKIE
jgi:hypothetical protein